MTPLDAVMLIEESDLDPEDPELIEAWQFLVDTGLAWKLQGWYGRTATRLIEQRAIAYGGAA